MATIQKLLTDIAAIQSAGRSALADKGVTVSADATVYDIMQSIETIPAGGGTEYSSIEYDEATNTYTLTEADTVTTHTLSCSYGAQGRINGMVYDNKNIAVEYNNDTVTVGGTVVDVSEYVEPGGAELNIAFGSTAPEDTTKLWVKADNPPFVTVDYNPDNTVETLTQLSTMLPREFWGYYSAPAIGKKVFLLGGYGDYYITEYDTESGTFTNRSFGYNLLRSEGVVIGNKIYIFSAINTNIYEYDPNTNTLTTKSHLPNTVQQCGVGAVGSKIYVFGGVSSGVFYNTICVYDTAANTITTLPVTLPAGTSGIGCFVVGTKIYLFGGQTSNGSLDTIQVFDANTNTLTTLTGTLPVPWYVPAIATFGTKCYLIGGGGSGTTLLDTIAVFDAATETATTLAATLPKAEGGAGGAVVGADCYLFGGWDGSVNLTTINKFTITFPLAEGDVYLQSDVFKNKFTLVTAPTEVETGVSAVYVGNAQNEAENAEAYLYDGTQWRPI